MNVHNQSIPIFENKYETSRKKLKTGDIVLFSSVSSAGRLFQVFGRSKWSHAALVLRVKDPDMVLCLEAFSNCGRINDFYAGEPYSGIRMTSLSDKIASFNGEVSVLSLNKPLTGELYKKLNTYRKKRDNKSLDFDTMNMLSAAFDNSILDKNDEDVSALFGGEIIAEIYQHLGLLASEKPAGKYTPRDFYEMPALGGGYRFNDEIKLKWFTE